MKIWRLLTSLFCIKRINISFVFELMFMYIAKILKVSHLHQSGTQCLQKGQRRLFVLPSFGSRVYLSVGLGFHYKLPKGDIQTCAVLFFWEIELRAFDNCSYYSDQSAVPNMVKIGELLRFILLIDWIQDTADFKSTILSIAIGHTLYFLLKVYPNLKYSICKNAFDTP